MNHKLVINKEKKLYYYTYSKIPNNNGLLIKNLYCGICSSDLRIIKQGHPALEYPRVPGHEIIGQIAKIGYSFEYLNKQGFKKGDFVQIYPGITCGNCKYCRTGRENLCKSIKIIGFNYDGGFSSYSHFANDTGLIHLTKLSSTNDLYLYSIAEPLASCINVFDNTPIYQEDKLLIIGSGFMGQLLSIVAYFFGIENQYIIDFNFRKLSKTLPSNPKAIKITTNNEVAKINEINPDIVILATGDFPEHHILPEVLSKGARICYFSGSSNHNISNNYNFNYIHYKEINIRGFYGSTPQQNKKAIKIIDTYKEFFKSFIGSEIYPLENYKNAFKKAYSHTVPKVIFKLF